MLITTHTLWLPIENWGLWFLHAAGNVPAAHHSHLNEKRCGKEKLKSVFSTRKLVVPYVSYDTIASWPRSVLTWGREEKVSHHLDFCISGGCPGPWLHAARRSCWLHWCVMRDGLKCLCMGIYEMRGHPSRVIAWQLLCNCICLWT